MSAPHATCQQLAFLRGICTRKTIVTYFNPCAGTVLSWMLCSQGWPLALRGFCKFKIPRYNTHINPCAGMVLSWMLCLPRAGRPSAMQRRTASMDQPRRQAYTQRCAALLPLLLLLLLLLLYCRCCSCLNAFSYPRQLVWHVLLQLLSCGSVLACLN
jgi:hypothetical protein